MVYVHHLPFSLFSNLLCHSSAILRHLLLDIFDLYGIHVLLKGQIWSLRCGSLNLVEENRQPIRTFGSLDIVAVADQLKWFSHKMNGTRKCITFDFEFVFINFIRFCMKENFLMVYANHCWFGSSIGESALAIVFALNGRWIATSTTLANHFEFYLRYFPRCNDAPPSVR